MKNKIRKIIPIICCFVMIIGSCIVSDAKTIKLTPLQIGTKYEFNYEITTLSGWLIDFIGSYIVEEANSDVYMVPALVNESETKQVFTVILVSDSSFKYIPYYYTTTTTSSGTNGSSSSANNKIHSSDRSVIDGKEVHYSFVGNAVAGDYNVSQMFDSITGSISAYMRVEYPFWSTHGKCEQIATAFKFFENDKLFDDGLALEYALQPSALIEPPKNLSIYRGYSNADKQYKFQLQWDKPIDTDLNVEVMYTIHYKDGLLGFGSHVYEKFPHLTHEDEHSAQTNKLQYLEDDLLKNYFSTKNMDLPSVYNITEIYVRFSKEIDGVINYSLWRKIEYLNLDEGNGFDAGEDDFNAESSTGAFDTSDNWVDQSVSNGEIIDGSDKENAKAPGLDANGDNITNVTSPIINPNIWDSDIEGVFDSFKSAISSAISFVGEFPSMVSEFFGFLPSWVVGCISIGLVMAVLLRLLGR